MSHWYFRLFFQPCFLVHLFQFLLQPLAGFPSASRPVQFAPTWWDPSQCFGKRRKKKCVFNNTPRKGGEGKASLNPCRTFSGVNLIQWPSRGKKFMGILPIKVCKPAGLLLENFIPRIQFYGLQELSPSPPSYATKQMQQ